MSTPTLADLATAIDDAHGDLHAALATPEARAMGLHEGRADGPTHRLATWLARLHEALHRAQAATSVPTCSICDNTGTCSTCGNSAAPKPRKCPDCDGYGICKCPARAALEAAWETDTEGATTP